MTVTLLQNPRNYTVQIRRPGDGAIVGTGVVVSMEGRVVTCAHVLRACGVEPRRPAGALVGVYFPQVRGPEPRERQAAVQACFADHDDDVVLLQLVGGPAPLGPEQIAVLGDAAGSAGHPFRAYGYRSLADYLAGFADGTIMGEVEPPPRRKLQSDPVQLDSPQINRGMSGAGVLDMRRNLVVGLVAETWLADSSGKDRDTGWAVNARVLSLAPLGLALRDAPLAGPPAPRPQVTLLGAQLAPPGQHFLRDAPAPLAEWVGRAAFLRQLAADWAEPGRRLVGLVGFGGEGKSSLARRWLQNALEGAAPPAAVFWWGFYERHSVDELAEELLRFVGIAVDPRTPISTSLRLQTAAVLLRATRSVLVLDGIEVLQHSAGDDYGLLESADLRSFLELLAAPGHQCFTLITSRAPLLDLLAYPGYAQRDVERLEPADGRALLRRLGVGGADQAIDAAVAAWDGHALTLSLLAAYLVERHGGQIARLADLPSPADDEPRYERVHRVLRRYDEGLGQAEQCFLRLFSAFRTPVSAEAFPGLFRGRVLEQPPAPAPGLLDRLLRREPAAPPARLVVRPTALNAAVTALDDAGFERMLRRLEAARLLRQATDGTYSTHPLIRAHYYSLLGARPEAAEAHAAIKDYYLANAGDTPQWPTLEQLQPLIELVHHACQAGAYDEAHSVVWERINQRERFVLGNVLGANETALDLCLEFFPKRDLAAEPLVSQAGTKAWYLNEAALALMSLGRLGEAEPLYRRVIAIRFTLKDWSNASRNHQNLASLFAHRGEPAASAAAAREALALARRAEDKPGEPDSLAAMGWALHLQGDAGAGAQFAAAEALEREIDPQQRHLYGLSGIQHAEHMRRAGDLATARAITEANLMICEEYHWQEQISSCQRLLGELAAAEGQDETARQQLDAALKTARGISARHVLIEALLARGRFWARRGQAAADRPDLDEALELASCGGYRIYEADTRAALAWLALAEGDRAAARASAGRARAMSSEMGYHWGGVDAEEALRAAG